MIEASKSPIIFIWLNSKLPSYGRYFIKLAKSNNPEREIILGCNQDINPIPGVSCHKIQINIKLLMESMKIKVTDSFFFATSARFYYLHYLAKKLNLKRFFHAEVDNAIFDLKNIDELFDRSRNGLFLTKDSQSRAIAGLMYCNCIQSLEMLLDIFKSEDQKVNNDMHALGVFSNLYPHSFLSLPTESYSAYKNHWEIICPSKVKGIFDAASLGQYLLGSNTQYYPDKNIYNLFINENCMIDLKNLKFFSVNNQLFVENLDQCPLPVFNLHVHSKSVDKFQDLMKRPCFLQNVNTGKKSLIKKKANPIVLTLIKIRYKLKSIFAN